MASNSGILPFSEAKKREDLVFFLPRYHNAIQLRQKPAVKDNNPPGSLDLRTEISAVLFDACLSCALGLSSRNSKILRSLGAKASEIMIDWRHEQIPGVFVDYGRAVNELNGEAFKQRCKNLLIALIAAARVDGHSRAIPQQGLIDLLGKYELNAGLNEVLQQAINTPVTSRRIASYSDSPVASAELYLLTLLIIDPEIVQQNMYLFLLAEELILPDTVIYQLEHQARSLLTLESLYENFGINATISLHSNWPAYN